MWATREDDATARAVRHGTLLVEMRHAPSSATRNILRYGRRQPLTAQLTLRLDADGTLHLLTRQRDETRSDSLPTGLSEPGEAATLAYAWDAEAGRGTLSAWRPGAGTLAARPLAAPLPLGPGDAAQLLGTAARAPGVDLVALATEAVPAGPQPGLCAQAPVAVPGGWRAACTLAAGDIVTTAEGRPARIRWAGRAVLPAAGRHRPVLLRAPYWGLREDLVVSSEQRVRLSGADVEYLFGEETVWVAAGDLVDGRSAIAPPGLSEVAWYHVVLDRPGALDIGGLAVAPLAPPANPATLWATCLAGCDGVAGTPAMPRLLRDFEARTLRESRAA